MRESTAARNYVIATFDSPKDLDSGAESIYCVADDWDPSAPSWASESVNATHYTYTEAHAEIARLRRIPGFWTEHAFLYRPAEEQAQRWTVTQ